MKAFIAIVKNTGAVVDKYQDFNTQAEADAHIVTFGGFVVSSPGGNPIYWVADDVAKTVVHDQASLDTDKAMSDWTRSMAATDGQMPRISEDIIDTMSNTQKAKLPQIVQDRLAAKKVLRGQKPDVPE